MTPTTKRTLKSARETPAGKKSANRTEARPAAPTKANTANAASSSVEERIKAFGGWRAETLAKIRRLIHEADPEVSEECKWFKPTNPGGVPVWSHDGIICTGEAYKKGVKITFMRGASLKDPKKLFNASLEGNARRAIDISEGEELDANAFKALIKAAVAENISANSSKAKPSSKAGTKAKSKAGNAKPSNMQRDEKTGIVLLSGGNPQIAKADGDAPVQVYIAAMPGWKSGFGKWLDDLIVRNAPNVQKAVRWNSPFYGIEGMGWFLSFHVFTRYVKVTFFSGTSLKPIPPGGTEKSKEVRWIDIYEDDQLDEAQMASWIKQAAAIPGWTP